MRALIAAVAAIAVSGAGAAPAENVSFEEVWMKVRGHNPGLVSSAKEEEAARIEARRASRHFFPRLMLDGRAFTTNDPGTSFISLLGQRSVTAADFAPDALNHPGTGFFQKGSLILDFPLFEGGAPSAQAGALEKAADARGLENQARIQGEFVRTASEFSSLAALRTERAEFERLRNQVADVISKYEVGARSNPVGYSGLLGLRSLRNRVLAMLEENTAASNALRASLESRAGGLPAGWEPAIKSSREFVNAKFPLPPAGTQHEPLAAKAALMGAEAAEIAVGAERARSLPKVGLFAQGDLVNGDRDSATAFSAGAYLQWELFSATRMGAARQAELRAESSLARAQAERERSDQGVAAGRAAAVALARSLELLDESMRLSEEQASTARTLFRSGSINALQLAEVYSRRADVISELGRAERELARVRGQLIVDYGVIHGIK